MIEGENPWADLEICCMVQNTYLQAASLGLSARVFALVRYGNVINIMSYKSTQSMRIAPTAGHAKGLMCRSP